MNDRTVEIRDGAVTFRVLSAGRGAPVVYFHSFHERGGWSPFLDRLAARFTVMAPFHPGVQGSSGVETLDDVLDLVLAYDDLFERLGLASAHLVGHFFGGMVAAELAAMLRHRASKLVLGAAAVYTRRRQDRVPHHLRARCVKASANSIVSATQSVGRNGALQLSLDRLGLIGLDNAIERGRIDITLFGEDGFECTHAQLHLGKLRAVRVMVLVLVVVRHNPSLPVIWLTRR